MDKRYNPVEVEEKWSAIWEKGGLRIQGLIQLSHK